MKKIIFLIVITIFLCINSVEAVTLHSSDEAIEWVKSKVGTSIDYDNAYGAQCIDLILAYYNYLGVNTVRGNAIDYTTNNLPTGWRRLKGEQPQKGDILIYSNSPYGHVAIYESDSSTFHQNYNHNYVENIAKKYNSFNIPYWGIIRPDFSNNEEIKELNLGDKFNAIIFSKSMSNLAITSATENDSANISLNNHSDDSLNQIWLFEKNDDNSYSIKNSISKNCMSVSNTGKKNKDNVYLTKNCESDNSKWFIYNYDESYRLVPKSAYSDKKALDILGNVIKNGNNMQIYEEYVSHNETQMFIIEKLLETIKVKNNNITMLEGDSLKIEYEIEPNEFDKQKILFESSDENVATVDSNGVIHAIWSGNSVINIKVSSRSNIVEKVNVSVNPKLNKLFSDVDENSWYYESVEYVSKNKIIKGYSNGTFGPNDSLTRAMFVTILHRLEKEVKVDSDIKFSDVSKDSWYSNAIRWAIKNKIIYGYNDGTFRPNNNITRQEFIVILFRYSNYKKNRTGNLVDITTYKDYNEIDEYALNAIEWAVGNKILYGSNEKIMPKKNITRAETATIMYRFIKKYKL